MIIKGGAGEQEAAAIVAAVAFALEEEQNRKPGQRPEPSAWVAAMRQASSRLRPVPPPPGVSEAGKLSRFIDQAQ